MECNKDESLRAKAIAEKKFMEKDIAGAKKFAIKAQNLFPALDGIGQMIATLDVHLAAEARVGGEKDWYAVLSISTAADDEMVKKQYRKLALQLHPDKNKSVGAEGAFQLISEAWNVLSDSTKRMAYDQKRNVRFQQRSSQPKRPQNASSSSSNGFYNFVKSATSTTRAEKQAAASSSSTVQKQAAATSSSTAPKQVASTSSSTVPIPPPPTISSTFWTSCNKCKMQYEHLRIYLNHNLLCPNCYEPFLATEIADPTKRTNVSSFNQIDTNKTEHGIEDSRSQQEVSIDSRNNAKFRWRPSDSSSASTTQAVNMVHQTYEKVRREREEVQAAVRREEALRRKYSLPSKRATNMSENTNHRRGDDAEEMAPGFEKTSSGNISGFKVPTGKSGFNSSMRSSIPDGLGGVSGDFWKSRMNVRQINLKRAFSQLDIKGVLIERTKLVLQRKLEEWNGEAVHREENAKAKKKQKPKEHDGDSGKHADNGNDTKKKKQKPKEHDGVNRKHADHGNGTEQERVGDTGKNANQDSDQKLDSNEEENEPVSIAVPDPDFHDFDKNRTENCFQDDQIWATYDDEDGMPRFYAFVQKVLSRDPFKIRMSFLTSKSNSEFGPLNWVSTGFTKTCGDFRIGRNETKETINIFSHRVKWEKGPRGIIRLYPKKGDIWALYRNWSPEWNEHTPDDVIYKYSMVEVLDEYNEDQGISVVPLVKVAGFKAVFQRHTDSKEIRRIPKEEMFRFSHLVPSYELTGKEDANAPKGCYELDPAATPLELLWVIPESKEK